jgi:hypothetical protein
MTALPKRPDASRAYESALESALTDLEHAQTELRDLRAAVAVVEARARDKRRLIDILMKSVSPARALDCQQRLAEMQSPFRLGRAATTTFDNVIDLFRQSPNRIWSATEAHRELETRGIPAEPDQVRFFLQLPSWSTNFLRYRLAGQ